MRSLSKVANSTEDVGTQLPDAYVSMAGAQIAFRRSGTSMIAGAPGSYKSVLALNLLALWVKAGCTGLYLSADADEFTVTKRMGAMLTNTPTDKVERDLTDGKRERYSEALAVLNDARFVFTPVNIHSIDRHMRSFEAVYGAFPDVVFIDNLMNCSEGNDNEWSELRQLTKDLDVLARASNSHICILHHAGENKDAPSTSPPPRWAIQGKLSQMPRIILTIAADGRSLQMACVKNTNGPQDPSGRASLGFMVAPTMRVSERWSQPTMGE